MCALLQSSINRILEAQSSMIGDQAWLHDLGVTFLPMNKDSWSIGTMDSLACMLDVS